MPLARSQSRHALIVEPSRAQRSVLAALLREVGADWVEASTMTDGLKRVDEEPFDLICVAGHLPDGDAEAFCQALRSAPDAPPVPVLVLARAADPKAFIALLQAGATEVFHRQDVERVRRFLATILPSQPTLSGRVLVIEDDPARAEGILTALRNLGLEADHVTNPLHALVRMAEQPVDLVITAVILDAPMSGAALVRELRALPGEAGRVPILVVSPAVDPARRIDLLRSGASDFMPTPVVAEELIARVEALLRGKRYLEQVESGRARLESLAVTDPLTTLNTRRFLDAVAPMYLAEARRHRFPLSVILVDVDHFDRINYTYGEPAGDNVLRGIGKLLRAECRRGDVAVRCSEEEFLLLLSHCGLNDAQRKAESLRIRIAGLKPAGIGVTASLGVTQAREALEEEFSHVFARAGQALEVARQGGRDQVAVSN